MKTLLSLFLACAAVVAVGQSPKELNGKWASEKAENLGTAFGERVFTFKKDTWELQFTMYGDEAMKMPLFTFRATGRFVIHQSKKGDIKPAVFSFDKKYLTLRTDSPDAAKNLGFVPCNLVKDVEREITESGCSFLVSKAACAQEYDLISLKDNKLYLGSRPVDGNMCTEDKRPTTLGAPLVRK